jgi:hypothetical protein
MDRYQEWYDSQVLKGRNVGGVLPPNGGNHVVHPAVHDRRRTGVGDDREAGDEGTEA